MHNPFSKLATAAMALTILLIVSGFVFYTTCVTYIDNYEFGYTFDARTGEVEALPRQGYVITPPLIVKVHTIDTRPMQVCITSDTHSQNTTGVRERVLNCKLVRFNPEGFKLFVSWHGRGDYSDNKLGNILKAYAYEDAGREYPFLEVMRELKTGDAEMAINVENMAPISDLPPTEMPTSDPVETEGN